MVLTGCSSDYQWDSAGDGHRCVGGRQVPGRASVGAQFNEIPVSGTLGAAGAAIYPAARWIADEVPVGRTLETGAATTAAVTQPTPQTAHRAAEIVRHEAVNERVHRTLDVGQQVNDQLQQIDSTHVHCTRLHSLSHCSSALALLWPIIHQTQVCLF